MSILISYYIKSNSKIKQMLFTNKYFEYYKIYINRKLKIHSYLSTK